MVFEKAAEGNLPRQCFCADLQLQLYTRSYAGPITMKLIMYKGTDTFVSFMQLCQCTCHVIRQKMHLLQDSCVQVEQKLPNITHTESGLWHWQCTHSNRSFCSLVGAATRTVTRGCRLVDMRDRNKLVVAVKQTPQILSVILKLHHHMFFTPFMPICPQKLKMSCAKIFCWWFASFINILYKVCMTDYT